MSDSEGDHKSLLRLKYTADRLFEELERKPGNVISAVSFHECIAMYNKAISCADLESEHNVVIKCHLNVAACFLRLEEWRMTVNASSRAIALATTEFSMESLRGHYLALCALLQLHKVNMSVLDECKEHASWLRSLRDKYHGAVPASDADEYERVLRKYETLHVQNVTKQYAVLERALALAFQLQSEGRYGAAARALSDCAHSIGGSCGEDQQAKSLIHTQAAFVYLHLREYALAAENCRQAHACTGLDALQRVLVDYLMALAVLGGAAPHSSTDACAGLQSVVAALEAWVLGNCSALISDCSAGCRLVVQMLSPQRHLIETALSFSRAGVPEPTTVTEALTQLQLDGYSTLVDGLGLRTETQCPHSAHHQLPVCPQRGNSGSAIFG